MVALKVCNQCDEAIKKKNMVVRCRFGYRFETSYVLPEQQREIPRYVLHISIFRSRHCRHRLWIHNYPGRRPQHFKLNIPPAVVSTHPNTKHPFYESKISSDSADIRRSKYHSNSAPRPCASARPRTPPPGCTAPPT